VRSASTWWKRRRQVGRSTTRTASDAPSAIVSSGMKLLSQLRIGINLDKDVRQTCYMADGLTFLVLFFQDGHIYFKQRDSLLHSALQAIVQNQRELWWGFRAWKTTNSMGEEESPDGRQGELTRPEVIRWNSHKVVLSLSLSLYDVHSQFLSDLIFSLQFPSGILSFFSCTPYTWWLLIIILKLVLSLVRFL